MESSTGNTLCFINHSGGAIGSDLMWETEGKEYGVKTISYSFDGHSNKGEHPHILTPEELKEGWEHLVIAEKTLKRSLKYTTRYQYVENLLCRNWFQVKNAESIFAVGTFKNKKRNIVNGGTGWAVQMAVDNGKNIFFFDQDTKSWWLYVPEMGQFLEMYELPKLTENFAGIGTRDLTEAGELAIKELYEETFKTSSLSEEK